MMLEAPEEGRGGASGQGDLGFVTLVTSSSSLISQLNITFHSVSSHILHIIDILP